MNRPKSQDVRDMFQQAARRLADRVAFHGGSLSVTYGELERTTNRLSSRLAARGITKGSAVAILSSRSFDYVVGIIAALKAGCSFVPLEPKTPPQRLAAMLEVAAPRCFLLGEGAAETVAASGFAAVETLAVDGRPETGGEAGEGPAPRVEIGPDDACYIYFTSGSTGRPKGIAGRYRAIAHYIQWEIEALGLQEGCRVSQLTAPSFDAFLRDLFTPLCAGGTLCAPESREVLLDAERLHAWLAAAEVQVIHTVPSIFRTLLHVDTPEPLPALRWVLLAGEPLLPSDVKRWTELYGTSSRLVNLYGPSETTMTKLVHFVTPADGERRTVPIGKPMPGSRALVLDADGKACPPRAVGEIHIRTPYRSLGYVGREDLTREVFIPNPFNSDPGDLIYRTGDLGRMLEDGTFEFLGRRDTQVKIRGVRIDLTEVEDLLLRHETIREAAVVDREDGTGTRFLCAYVVAGAPLAAAELRDFLGRSLPEHSLPSVFVPLESLPRTASGKVDRLALPAPEKLRPEAGLTAPRSGAEEMVAGLFARVLGLPRVGVHESFFALGGHSLLATQLLSQVRLVFQVELSLPRLFAAPTIVGLAATIEAELRSGSLPPAPPLVPVPRGGPLPLSFAQERLWLLDRLQPGRPLYTIPLAVRFQGALPPAVLTAALTEIGYRHEALRTTFHVAAGQPWQTISQSPGLVLHWIDLRGLPAHLREAEAAAWISADACRSFDLTRGPLARVVLLQTGEQDHLALLAMHHIASDLWSLGVFLRELGVLYRAFLAGRPQPLPRLPVQYADFSVWQRSWLAGEVLDRQMAYWKDRLAGLGEPLELPTDRPRPAEASFRGARRRHRLGGELPARLKELTARQGSTLFMVVMAGFLTWLHRVSGRQRITLGVPVANRNRAELEGLIGFFVNTLVLRTDVAGDLAFRDLLARVREATLGAYVHQDLPFEKLVQELRPDRDLTRNPLFQVMLAFQNAPLEPLDLPGLKLTPTPVDAGMARFDLTLFVAEEEAGLALQVEYATDLFDETTILRALGQLECLLAGAAQKPGAGLLELPFLGEPERHQVLTEWNDSELEALPPLGPLTGFPEIFQARAQRSPDAVAAACGAEQQTYGELDGRSERLARALAGLGVKPETVVAVLADRGLGLLTAMLALFKAGGAYLPLDPHHPPHRMAQVLRESGARLVLAARGYLPVVAQAIEQLPAGARPRSADLDAPPPGVAAQPRRAAGPDGLAYVIYTSGSTGTPKGAMVAHRGMLNHLRAKIRDLALGPGDVIAQTAPQCFDISIWQFLAALAEGGRVEICPDEVAQSPARLLRAVEASGVTVLETVPSLLRVVIEEASLAAGGREGAAGLSALRRMIPTGEALPPDLCRRWLELFPGIPLVNAYGPTECSDDVSHYTVRGAPAAHVASIPIGRPVANTRLYVTGRSLQPLPMGAAGELCVGGEGVGRGYLRDPLRTAGVFVPDPFSPRPGDRLYRTGDLARWRADGALQFLGRIDRQVKIRGRRIELGEIEAVLAGHPGVGEAVVLATEGNAGDQRLVACVVTRDAGLTAAALEVHLRGRLPEYMVPAGFVFPESLPLTPHGKVDLRALAALAGSAPADSRSTAGVFRAPSGRTEELLAGIWAEVLGLERVGAGDDFFAAGGHSLLGIQVISRAREAFGVELPLRDLFEAPVLSALARRVEEARGDLQGRRRLRIERVSRQGELPLSFSQRRLWFLDQLAPDSPAYNVPVALRLAGEVRRQALASALTEIVRRHEALRTTFPAIDGKPWQRIAAPGAVDLPLVDLDALPGSRRAAEARCLASEEARRPFRLDRGPLLRATLVRLAPADHLALITMHHAVSDGWSWLIFVREMTALYAAFLAAELSPLPELAVQYADFAHWQQSWLQGAVLAAEVDHWRGRLRGAPTLLDLPLDRPRPPVRSWHGAACSRVLPAELSRDLLRLSRREGVTLFMTLLAAFQVLLHRHGAQARVPVGTPVAGRNHIELEPLIGFFVNTLVLSTDLGDQPTFRELLARVREDVLDADAHQELPFEKLVEELAPERNLSHTPLFQVMLAFQVAPPEVPDLRGLQGLRVTPVRDGSGTAKFDLTLVARQEGERVHLELEHATELFTGPTAAGLLERLQNLLTGAAADPGQRLAEIPLLGAAERHQLLTAWNDTEVPYGTGLCLHELLAAQAARTPEAVAVTFEDGALSYRELDGRAGRLARRLRALGVGAEALVGVAAHRSFEMVVGLLAILKAGGAYVPLDPGYPEERLAFMLEDAGVRILLTQESLAERFAALAPVGVRQVLLDAAGCGDEPAGALVAGTEPDNAAYAIFTSGSTGRPKVAVNTHRSIVNRLLWMQEAYQLTAADRVLQKTPFSFDVSVWEFFWPLLVGARLVVARPDGHRDSAYLVDLIEQEKVTTLHFVPSMLQVFLEEPELGQPGRFAGLRRVMASGEALPPELERRFMDLLGQPLSIALHNLYGPTEAAVDVTSWVCGRETRRRTVPIGRPIANVRIHLLDRHGLVPIGVAGELHIGGVALARGYLNRPELTAERFVPDPFSAAPGGRLYRTGDLVRHLPAGDLEFLGRSDDQVKVRGFRIELGEIETVLRSHPDVKEAVLMVREEDGSRRLISWLVLRRAVASPALALSGWLRAKLPEHMIPAAFVVLEALPLTPTGKIDRKALPAPERHADPALHRAPGDAVEMRLAAIWCEVLRLDHVGVHDNFFQLGGDSILSIQVVSRAVRAGLSIKPWQIFEHQTIAALAAVASHSGARREARHEARHEMTTGEVPLTPVQRWFFDAEPADPHHFNQSVLLAAQRRVDEDLLRRAVSCLLSQHDTLRLRFERGGSGWRQTGQPPGGEPPVVCVDLGALPAARRTAALAAAAADVQGSLDLGRGRLVRVALFRGGREQPAKVLLAVHHLAVDGVSWRILLEDLETAYTQLEGGAPLELPSTTSSYGEWARRLAGHATPNVDHELAFWTAPSRQRVARLPRDGEDGEGDNTVASEDRVSVALDAAETAALLKDVPQAYRTQINDTLLTALVQSFAAWTGVDTLLVDLEGHGREEIAEDVDLSRTVGWFTSIFPVLLHLADAGDPGEALVGVKEQLRAVPGRGIGYGLLRYLADGEAADRLRALPCAEVSFNYLGQFDSAFSAAGPFRPADEPSGPPRSLRQRRRYAIEVTGLIFGGRLQATFSYSRNLHRPATLERLADGFAGALRNLIDHCRSPWARAVTPSDFPLANLSRGQLAKAIGQLGQAKV